MKVEPQTSFIAEELAEVNKTLSEADITALRINMKLVQDPDRIKANDEFRAAERQIKKCTPDLEDGQNTARYKVTDYDDDEEPVVLGEIAVKRKKTSATKAKEAGSRSEKSIVAAPTD